jgi:hypothetical protein
VQRSHGFIAVKKNTDSIAIEPCHRDYDARSGFDLWAARDPKLTHPNPISDFKISLIWHRPWSHYQLQLLLLSRTILASIAKRARPLDKLSLANLSLFGRRRGVEMLVYCFRSQLRGARGAFLCGRENLRAVGWFGLRQADLH